LPGNALEQGRELGEQLLQAREAELGRRGIAHRSVLSFEPARAVLDATARETAARLVLVGARGTGAMEKLLLGSVSSYLSVYAERPVAVVHRQAS
jgi:nucleotide-binding universal stress UspA family protein